MLKMIWNDKCTHCVYNVYIYLSKGHASKCLHCVDWRFRSIISIISRGFQQKHWDRCDLSENWPALDIFLTKFVIILFGFWNLPDYLNYCGCEGQSRQNVEGWDEHVEPLVCRQVYNFLWVSLYYNGMREVIKWQFEDKKLLNFNKIFDQKRTSNSLSAPPDMLGVMSPSPMVVEVMKQK